MLAKVDSMVGLHSKQYLHAWRLNFVIVQCWVSTDKAAYFPDDSICVIDELSEVNEHHAADKHPSRLNTISTCVHGGDGGGAVVLERHPYSATSMKADAKAHIDAAFCA